jgi:uncharacterized lipoprotein NlpE involved in copper resistance
MQDGQQCFSGIKYILAQNIFRYNAYVCLRKYDAQLLALKTTEMAVYRHSTYLVTQTDLNYVNSETKLIVGRYTTVNY